MTILKGILKYGLILIALLVGAVFVVGAVMVLVPSVSVFGYKYVNIKDNDKLYERITLANFGGAINAIDLDVAGYDVVIGHADDDEMWIRTQLSGVGFYKAQYADEEQTKEIAVEDLFVPKTNISSANKNGVLKITAPEVNGALNFTERVIYVYLPKSVSTVSKLEAKTTAGKVDVKDLTIPTVKLTSDSGDQILTDVAISEFTSVTRKGNVTVDVSANKNASNYNIPGNVTIKSKFGVVKIHEGITIGTNNLNKLVIENDKAEINLGTVRSNIEYSGEAGLVNVKTVSGELLIRSNDAKFNIQTTNGDKIDAVGEGMLSLDIKNLSAKVAIIKTQSGYVTIENLTTPNSTITTNTGNVKLGKVLNSTTVVTKSGNVTLDQKDVTVVPGSVIKISTERGIIKAKDIVSGLEIKSESGAVTVDVRMITGNILIDTNIARAEVTLPIAQYDLVTKSESGEVTVDDVGVTVTTNVETTSHVNHEAEAEHASMPVVTVKSTSGNVVVTGDVEEE